MGEFAVGGHPEVEELSRAEVECTDLPVRSGTPAQEVVFQSADSGFDLLSEGDLPSSPDRSRRRH